MYLGISGMVISLTIALMAIINGVASTNPVEIQQAANTILVCTVGVIVSMWLIMHSLNEFNNEEEEL